MELEEYLTDTEELLYLIAKTIIMMNPNLNILITGSLMLSLRGIKKRREAHDIDFIMYWEEEEFPEVILPDSFDIIQDYEHYEDDSLKVFYSKEYKITVDFIKADESLMRSDGIFYSMKCASLRDLIEAKIYYASKKKNENYLKHKLDLIYMQENNNLDKVYFVNFKQ